MAEGLVREMHPGGEEAPQKEELKRGLGGVLVLALAFSSIMGTGMFLGAATGARFGGPASLLVWPPLIILSLYIAACFGELSSMFPKAGGIYEFCKQAYGRMPSFFVGWIGWIAGNFNNTISVVAGVEYLLPGPEKATLRIAASIGIVVLLNIVAFFGVEGSARVVMVFVIITILIVLGVVTFGVFHFDPANYHPLFPSGYLITFVAFFFLLESFFGWESVTYMAEETKDPQRNIPRALLLGTLAVGVASFLVHFISLGVVSWQQMRLSSAPLSLVFSMLFPPTLELPLRVGIFLTLVGAAAGGIVSMPRLLLALARDKLFLTQFRAIHPVFNTPYKAILFQTLASVLIIAMTIGHYQRLLGLLVPLSLFLYTITLITVPTLRRRASGLQRAFRVPLGNVLPYLIGLGFIALIGYWATTEPLAFPLLALGGSLILIGLPLYFLIELYYDQEMITGVRDLTARVGLLTEGIFSPKKVQKEIFAWFEDLRGKTILEFGCGTGSLTLQLAEAVGSEGTVYATDISINNLKIAKRRIEQEAWRSHTMIHGKVYILHDQEHMVRIHPQVRAVDIIVSFGMLSYLQDVDRVLREMYAVLPEGGKICFVEYVDYLKLLPNPEWLSKNEEIERIFRKAGLSVRVQRKKSPFWNYVFLYGIKLSYDVAVV